MLVSLVKWIDGTWRRHRGSTNQRVTRNYLANLLAFRLYASAHAGDGLHAREAVSGKAHFHRVESQNPSIHEVFQ